MGVIPTRMMPLGAWRGNALPYSKQVQYIVFDGTQCVETAAPANTMKLRVVYNGHPASGTEFNVLGLYDNMTGTVNRVYVGRIGSSTRCMLVASEYNIIYQSVQDVYAEQIVDVPGKLHTLKKNGSTYTKTIGNFGTFVAQGPIGLGGRNVYHTTSGHFSNECMLVGNVYIFERWDSGVQTAKYIPVVDLNGVACFYDEIGGALHYSWTGNALTAGPDA